jgi:DNA-binding protein WhiA
MSFSLEVKEELLQKIPKRLCCQKALLSSFFLTSKNEKSHMLFFPNSAIGRYLVSLLKKLRIHRWGMGISKRGKIHKGILILEKNFAFPSVKLLKSCCLKNYLKGAFLCCGSMTSPQKAYHVEFRVSRQEHAKKLCKALKQAKLPAGVYVRRRVWVVFLKNGEAMAHLLNTLQAISSYLHFEEIRALKETKNQVRRQVNYETANVVRVVRAASRQRNLFLALMKNKTWRTLSSTLKKTAEARVRYPNLSLRDLAKKLGVSKSALNHRLRRLEAILS